MNWFQRQPGPAIAVRKPHARPPEDHALLAVGFACSTCGRTDLPETGDWDAPICQECDAAINEDAICEEQDSSDPDEGW